MFVLREYLSFLIIFRIFISFVDIIFGIWTNQLDYFYFAVYTFNYYYNAYFISNSQIWFICFFMRWIDMRIALFLVFRFLSLYFDLKQMQQKVGFCYYLLLSVVLILIIIAFFFIIKFIVFYFHLFIHYFFAFSFAQN